MCFLQVSAKKQWRQNLHAALVDVLEEQWFVHKLSRKHLLEEKPVFEMFFVSYVKNPAQTLAKPAVRASADNTVLLHWVFSNKRKSAIVAFLSPGPVQVKLSPSMGCF